MSGEVILRRLSRLNITAFLFLGLLIINSSFLDVSSASTAKVPRLNCVGSGEITGLHPGWSTLSAQQLTVVQSTSSSFRVYWCPAAAPQGTGMISYTLTSMLGAITCETTLLTCTMSGISTASKLSLMASDETGSYPSEQIAIQNSGIPTPCVRSPMKCNIGPGFLTFPTYGNSAPTGMGSCTFAAVANWQEIALGLHPDPSLINKQFVAAGGNVNLGLTTDQVFNYWRTFGIAGVFLDSSKQLPIDPVNVQRAIDDPNIRVIIASLNLGKNQNFAGISIANPSYHWVVVDGYTPQGPLVVTWGQTLQMTWQQWNLEAVTTWTVSTGNQLKSLLGNQ